MSSFYPTPPNSPLAAKRPHRVETIGKCNGYDSPPATDASVSGFPTNLRNGTPDSSVSRGSLSSQIDPSMLKSLLHPNEGECGCPKKSDKQPCKRSAAITEQSVNSLVASIATLDPSSPKLVDELQSLAEQVHCWQHDHGEYVDSRVEQWVAAFSAIEIDTQPVLSFERQIKMALRPCTTKCTGKKKNGEPCTKKVGGQKMQNCTKTIDEITQLAMTGDIAYLLEVLERNMFCAHHNTQALKYTESWTSKIKEICRTHQVQPYGNTLEDCNARIYCRGCRKQHIEWFVVEKWSKWMDSRPYQREKGTHGPELVLKAEETISALLKDLSL
ncbi:hypothetical protein QQS21_008486 [Conoideocrella luteorostrata]|uniref:Uncharacterized protein n=1 Tax=Conoideocrella luteorostrata TaxID=1105319 RepID=A0AAJ0CIT0_9HYPO|nr:hypothetical protein QQS21_008486 [Conoideocrella luteorostrata]